MQTSQISYDRVSSYILDLKKKCFDISFREFMLHNNSRVFIAYLSSLSDELQITLLINHLLNIIDTNSLYSEKDLIVLGNIQLASSWENAQTSLLSGLILFSDSKSNQIYCIENRKYPSRGISEPETEKSVRSSRDGFIESFLFNIALIRKRIRDPHLNIITYQFGNKTHVDVGLLYIDDIVDLQMLEFSKRKLDGISGDENIVNERQLAECVFNSKLNPYPFVRYTERVDIAAIHLLQGKIILVIDNSPSVIILPTTFFEQCKQIEEYSQTKLIGTLLVLLRFIGVFISLYLLPIWCILVALKYTGISILYIPSVENLATFCFQIILCDIVVEFLRIAIIHSPVILTSIIGVVAAFILGQMSIDFGYFTSEVILYVALANVGTFMTPGYELSMANKLSRILIVLLILLFSYYGGIVGIVLHVLILGTMKSGDFHYLYPIYPFDFKEFKRVFFRFSPIFTKSK